MPSQLKEFAVLIICTNLFINLFSYQFLLNTINLQQHAVSVQLLNYTFLKMLDLQINNCLQISLDINNSEGLHFYGTWHLSKLTHQDKLQHLEQPFTHRSKYNISRSSCRSNSGFSVLKTFPLDMQTAKVGNPWSHSGGG